MIDTKPIVLLYVPWDNETFAKMTIPKYVEMIDSQFLTMCKVLLADGSFLRF